MVVLLMLCSGTAQNGVSVSRCFASCSWVKYWEWKGVFCYLVVLLSAGRAARRAGGKWLPDCFLLSCSVQGSRATPPAPCPSRTPGMDRAGRHCHLHTARGGVGQSSQHTVQRRKIWVIFNSLISNKSKCLVFCLSCSSKKCPLPCRI